MMTTRNRKAKSTKERRTEHTTNARKKINGKVLKKYMNIQMDFWEST